MSGKINMQTSKFTFFGKDRRKYKRIALKQGAYAAISPNSFKIGQIKNISRGGLLFNYLAPEHPPQAQVENHLFLSSSNAYVSKLPFKSINDRPVHSCETNENPSMRERSIEFGKLTLLQMIILNKYIVINRL